METLQSYKIIAYGQYAVAAFCRDVMMSASERNEAPAVSHTRRESCRGFCDYERVGFYFAITIFLVVGLPPATTFTM